MYIAGVAFQVATSLTSSQGPVRFKHDLINFGNAYDKSRSKFCTKNKGFYWLHFDTVTDKYLNADYSLADDNGNYILGVLRTGNSTHIEVDVLSQDIIIEAEKVACMQMTSSFATFDFMSSIYSMTWAGFTFKSEVVFSLVINIFSLGDKQVNYTVNLNIGKFSLIINVK